MEILGIGVPELLFIVLLILVLFGPKDMVTTGKTLGRWLNQLVRSPTYKLLTKTGDELRNLPRNLMRESNLEEYTKEMQQLSREMRDQSQQIGSSLARSFDEKQVFAQTASEKDEIQTAPENPQKAQNDNPIAPPQG